MTLELQFSKFPFAFWFLTTKTKCEITQDNLIIKDKHYTFKSSSRTAFLAAKYAPIMILFAVLMTRYDLPTSRSTLIAYMFAILLCFAVFYAARLARIILVVSLLLLEIFVAFFTSDLSIVAFSLKYSLLFITAVTFISDLKTNAYVLMRSGKTLAHFTCKTSLLKSSNEAI